jgi:hypothetical protein
MNKCGALVGRQLQGKTEVIGKKYLPQCHVLPPSITHGLAWECTWTFAVTDTHVMARPD